MKTLSDVKIAVKPWSASRGMLNIGSDNLSGDVPELFMSKAIDKEVAPAYIFL